MFQDLGVKSALFKHASGVYSMDLIIGDPLLKNPIVWQFSNIKLKFSEVESVASEPHADFYKPKKLISVRISSQNIIYYNLLILANSMYIFVAYLQRT